MTYNWNNMVPITVPTGTNGWLYSGEVIINGVKVRFPVGVPTSVPEPAAVLLKKMIELEQEKDANTAKPQNHYVGDVTIPAGKTLTLEKGAKFVDNSGGSAPVVIVPETELTTNDEGELYLMEPPSALPEYGATCAVTYNGVVYDCPVIDGTAIGITGGYIMGNTTGTDLPASNPDAPFIIILFAAGTETPGGTFIYGQCTPLDGETSATLSIVQTGGGTDSGGSEGGVFTINAIATGYYPYGEETEVEVDKTAAEIAEAVKNGKICRAVINGVDHVYLSTDEYTNAQTPMGKASFFCFSGVIFGPFNTDAPALTNLVVYANDTVKCWSFAPAKIGDN